jgi:hypothetical protein
MTITSPSDTIVLFNAQTTDGNSTAANLTYSNHKACVKIFGTFNGATIALQVAAPTNVLASTWLPLKDRNGNVISATAAAVFFIEDMVYDDQIRAVQSSSGASTSLYCTLQPTG